MLYIGRAAAQTLQATISEDEVVDPAASAFELSASQIGRRVNAATKAAGLGEGFTGHSGRVGMARDRAASGVELPELMTASQWKSSRMPTQYTERQAATGAQYYQGRGFKNILGKLCHYRYKHRLTILSISTCGRVYTQLLCTVGEPSPIVLV